MNRTIFFFLGTEAELIKIFPVIIEAKKRGISYKIIASGQNDIVNSNIFRKINCGNVDLELSKESDIKKNAIGLLRWWIKTYSVACEKIKRQFPEVDFEKSKIVVHGDTVSTYMGAKIGKKLGMQVCHVEAGLRSHNIFSPFPEEIDRMLTSRIAGVHFAPGEIATDNLCHVQGEVVNTKHNTLLDSLAYSKNIPLESDLTDLLRSEYFVFVMHRQENLANKKFVMDVVSEIVEATKKRKCVIIMHEITKNVFESVNILKDLKTNNNIILMPRMDYFDFMKILDNSLFVITDGGSNQEELYYMAKPCLIMRTTTERNEGIGKNARLFNGQADDVRNFLAEVEKMEIKPESLEGNPSKIIMDYLEK